MGKMSEMRMLCFMMQGVKNAMERFNYFPASTFQISVMES